MAKMYSGIRAQYKTASRVLRHEVKRNRINLIEAAQRQKEQIALIQLMAQVRREVDPIIEAIQRAESDSYCVRNGIENSPELYGKKRGFDQIYTMHGIGADANPEMGETCPQYANAQTVQSRQEKFATPPAE